MKKGIFAIIILILVVVIASILVKGSGDTPENLDENEQTQTESTSVVGEIININTEQVPVDGPTLITLQSDAEAVIVAVPSMGINLCAAQENIADPFELEVGDVVEVHGELNDERQIVPCDDASHYLRVVGEE